MTGATIVGSLEPYGSSEPTKASTIFTTGGMDVNATITVPKRPIERLDNAAALGSELSNIAVAIADAMEIRS